MTALIRDRLERHQLWFYVAGFCLGLGWAFLAPGARGIAEILVWPLLTVLLSATFAQTPFALIPSAFKDVRFMTTALLANFVLVPVLVWLLVQLLPSVPAMQWGLALVLLVPCTDWFLTFTHLGGGDMPRAVSLTPVNLLLQLLLLPIYLPLVTEGVMPPLSFSTLTPVVLLLVVPLILAAICERTVFTLPAGQRIQSGLAWMPVPVLALLILCVATANGVTWVASIDVLWTVVVASLAFAVLALTLSLVLARSVRLPAAHGRTLAFTLLTRNSFVVLPLALALPAGWELASLTVVTQSFVELSLLILGVRLVPRLFPTSRD